MKASILIVDGEENVAESIRFVLQKEGYQVSVAPTAGQALRLFDESQPALVILDLVLPDHSGLDVCRSLRLGSQVPILVLTAHDDLQDKVLALELGADDYLLKPFRGPELLARAKALIRRTQLLGPRLAYGDIVMDVATHSATYEGRELPLTLREFQLLERLLQRPQKVCSKQQLLRHLWGWDGNADTNVVEVHISALRAKLGAQGRRLIRTIRGVGYALG